MLVDGGVAGFEVALEAAQAPVPGLAMITFALCPSSPAITPELRGHQCGRVRTLTPPIDDQAVAFVVHHAERVNENEPQDVIPIQYCRTTPVMSDCLTGEVHVPTTS